MGTKTIRFCDWCGKEGGEITATKVGIQTREKGYWVDYDKIHEFDLCGRCRLEVEGVLAALIAKRNNK
jgi:hypothetical protein